MNLTEQWPCQTSWLIHYYETHEADVDDSTPLRTLFERIRNLMPISKELEQLQTMDHDVKKLELCLSLNSQALQIGNLRMFIPFAINLDPYIRRVLQDTYHSQSEQHQAIPLQRAGSARTTRHRPFTPPQAVDPRYMALQTLGNPLQHSNVTFDVPQTSYSSKCNDPRIHHGIREFASLTLT